MDTCSTHIQNLNFEFPLLCDLHLVEHEQHFHLAVKYCYQMNVTAITIDGAFTTRYGRFLHAKQESEIMMILTSVLANLGP